MIHVTHPVVLWWRAIYGLLIVIGLIIIALVYFETIMAVAWTSN